MRACLCYRNNGSLYKAVWFTESRTGLYLGYFGSNPEHHHSFHTDGRRHLRTRESVDLLPKADDRAIGTVKGYRQLLNASLPLMGATTHSEPFIRIERADVVMMLDVAAAGDRVSMDYYLLHRSFEADYLNHLRWWPKEMPPHQLALCATISLSNFPDHKVGFVAYAPGPQGDGRTGAYRDDAQPSVAADPLQRASRASAGG